LAWYLGTGNRISICRSLLVLAPIWAELASIPFGFMFSAPLVFKNVHKNRAITPSCMELSARIANLNGDGWTGGGAGLRGRAKWKRALFPFQAEPIHK
jgi:hypothetical protein